MGKYFSSKEFIEIGVLSIALIIIFVHSLINFSLFMKYRKRFYEDYISCFHSKEDKPAIEIVNLFFILLMIIMVVIRGKNYIASSEKEHYLEIILYVMLTILMIFDLISIYIHMRTDFGISAEYISFNSVILPNDKVVYEEYENEIIIYRKSRKKEKGVKLVSQAYDINKDQKFLDYVHTYYQKVKPII